MAETYFSELFWSSFILTIVACSIKMAKLCVYTVYSSQLFEGSLVRTQSNATATIGGSFVRENPLRQPNGISNV